MQLLAQKKKEKKLGLQPMQIPAKKKNRWFQQCGISRIGLHEKLNIRTDSRVITS